MWVFYIELSTGNYLLSALLLCWPHADIPDFLKLTTYLVFFTLIITFYGLPLNIVRDVYITARSFITRLRALQRYQTATRNMDQRYPDASEEEMTAMSDRTCIICREEMVLHERHPDPGQGASPGSQPQAPAVGGPNTTPKKLPCGHIFHFYCLRSWLERQQSCPTWSVSPKPPMSDYSAYQLTMCLKSPHRIRSCATGRGWSTCRGKWRLSSAECVRTSWRPGSSPAE